MKQLRETLVLTDARAISLLRQITKDGNTYVLQVKGPLTPELADTLRCRNQVYNIHDQPYAALKSFAMDHQISACELSALNMPKLQPSMVTGFIIKPNEEADADGELEVFFRMKFSVGKKELNGLLDTVDGNPFDLSLLSLQQSLFDMPSSTEDGPEGGTKVDMSGGDDADADTDAGTRDEEDPVCVSCENDIGMAADGLHHTNGTLCKNVGTGSIASEAPSRSRKKVRAIQ
jgi:hypothetical protein